MKERPILFNAAMVRALLDGRKTQTRRIAALEVCDTRPLGGGHVFVSPKGFYSPRTIEEHVAYCPKGQPGDRLWVREAWAARLDQDHLSPSQLPHGTVGYWADGPGKCCNTGCAGAAGRVRASMHMPRWASRILLEITSVRVERVQEISNHDCMAEGITDLTIPLRPGLTMHRSCYADLWDSINNKHGFGWDVNPWVWVIEFKRITP